jgi:hypothetical protein
MRYLFIAGALFVVAVISGVSVSYFAMQPWNEDVQHQLQFLREQHPRHRQQVAQLHLTNLTLLLSEEREKALSFNCLFLESELLNLSQFQYINQAEQARVAELIDRGNAVIAEVKEMELCQW